MSKKQLNTEELKKLHAEEYVDHFNQNREANKNRIRGILGHIKLNEQEVVCDYGCGNGLLFEEIHDKVQSYTGVDFSTEFIKSFEEKLNHTSFNISPKLVNRDIVDFAKDHQNTFDTAFTLDFSEHLYDEDFERIYRAVFETIKPNGRLVFHTPNGGFFIEWLKNKGLMKQQEQHIGVRNFEENKRLLSRCGFNAIQVTYIAHYNVLKYLHALSFIPLLGKVFRARLLLVCIKN